MNYLSPSEYEAYGLEASLPEAWVTAASSLLDAHCRRSTLGIAQYVERLRLAAGRNTARLSYLPLAASAPATSPIVSARARFATPRRGEGGFASATHLPPITDLAYDVAQAFTLPGTWTMVDPAAIDYFSETGELTFPMGPLGLAYNEIEITYTAGLADVPDAVKFACAQVIRNAQATPALNVRASTIDRMHLEYFQDSIFDQTVTALLAPYVAQKVAS
ncbi:MAG TPA: hypothetical protein VFA60_00655 [Terriglobales bacterium]|nr:hypothetical protein [Terriglobales bacterium]